MPYLEYQWQTGAKSGEIEHNKESNISASIHKFQTIRKASGTPVQAIEQGEATGGSVIERLEEQIEATKNNTELLVEMVRFMGTVDQRLKSMQEIINNQQHMIKNLTDEIDRHIAQNDILVKQQDAMNKLIEKVVQ
ncbi:hypothetical protein [Paenibacillus sp. OV219]|uniref:hypothetical protein n=1 Tax=Paenibacillus sp. OV219 TaxID=1884377 RepID=UPI0008AF66D7|nr:hypothetical protein [Paenibacillus sp. OV219]SEP18605.1 hypothetical protein SAMN05518847_1283 [Paenibacillus sp. OV219]